MTAMPNPIIRFAIGLLTVSAVMTAVASGARAGDDPANYTIEEVQACSGDAMRLCRDALPDINKIESCMEAKKAQLSKGCQAMFAPGRKR